MSKLLIALSLCITTAAHAGPFAYSAGIDLRMVAPDPARTSTTPFIVKAAAVVVAAYVVYRIATRCGPGDASCDEALTRSFNTYTVNDSFPR